MMWGGHINLLKRARFWTANRTEIAAMAGQKTLGSIRGAIMLGGFSPPVAQYCNKGSTINAKAIAANATIAHASIVGVGNLGRPNS
jgi:hypothetical protein